MNHRNEVKKIIRKIYDPLTGPYLAEKRDRAEKKDLKNVLDFHTLVKMWGWPTFFYSLGGKKLNMILPSKLLLLISLSKSTYTVAFKRGEGC